MKKLVFSPFFFHLDQTEIACNVAKLWFCFHSYALITWVWCFSRLVAMIVETWNSRAHFVSTKTMSKNIIIWHAQRLKPFNRCLNRMILVPMEAKENKIAFKSSAFYHQQLLRKQKTTEKHKLIWLHNKNRCSFVVDWLRWKRQKNLCKPKNTHIHKAAASFVFVFDFSTTFLNTLAVS